jgi:hypothetical protein
VTSAVHANQIVSEARDNQLATSETPLDDQLTTTSEALDDQISGDKQSIHANSEGI